MKQKIKNLITNTVLGLVLIVLLGVIVMAMGYVSNKSMKQREKIYLQGQYDALYGQIDLTRVVKNGENLDAYAQGFDDANDGKIRIKAITDSTFVFTSSPWKKGGTIPKDTIKIKQ